MSLEIASVAFDCPQDEQSAPGRFLKMTAKRYTSPDYPADIRGLTLIFAHGVGGCKSLWPSSLQFDVFNSVLGPDKEQWEPMISEIFCLQHSKAPHQRIHEAWALDRQNHGDAALLNREELSTSRPGGVCELPYFFAVSGSNSRCAASYEWADGIAAFVRSPGMRGKRLVAISHSAGALAMQVYYTSGSTFSQEC
jgi:pimeloyl-ACP methyl ester carboxylesterase